MKQKKALHERSKNPNFGMEAIVRVWTLDDKNEGSKGIRRAVKTIIRKNWPALAGVLDGAAREVVAEAAGIELQD